MNHGLPEQPAAAHGLAPHAAAEHPVASEPSAFNSVLISTVSSVVSSAGSEQAPVAMVRPPTTKSIDASLRFSISISPPRNRARRPLASPFETAVRQVGNESYRWIEISIHENHRLSSSPALPGHCGRNRRREVREADHGLRR